MWIVIRNKPSLAQLSERVEPVIVLPGGGQRWFPHTSYYNVLPHVLQRALFLLRVGDTVLTTRPLGASGSNNRGCTGWTVIIWSKSRSLESCLWNLNLPLSDVQCIYVLICVELVVVTLVVVKVKVLFNPAPRCFMSLKTALSIWELSRECLPSSKSTLQERQGYRSNLIPVSINTIKTNLM